MSYEIKNPTMWFFTTIEETNEGGIPRMRALPGQYISDGKGGFEQMDDKLNVQSDSRPRSENPIGTIFVSKVVTKTNSTGGTPYYSTGEKNISAMARGVTSDVKDAYNKYLAEVGGTPLEEEPGTPATPKPVGTALIDKLLDECPCPTVLADNFYVSRDVWAALLFNVHKGYNTMLVGESGTGKTELTQLLGRAMKKDVKIFDMGAKQDPIASLVGVHRFDGKSVFDRADFTFAIESPGIVVLDELPRAPMNTNNILFPVLDSRRTLAMDIAAHELREIKVHSDCRFVATANEGFRYTGNNVLDQALKERFQIIIVEFMPAEEEVKLLYGRTGLDKSQGRIIVKIAKAIRDAAAKDDLTMGVSIRHTLYAADLASAGLSLPKALEQAFLPMFIREEERKIVKDILASR
jgi:nitric oxide reductase NorQ protein